MLHSANSQAVEVETPTRAHHVTQTAKLPEDLPAPTTFGDAVVE